jgi:hypothetical protein
MGRQAVSLMVKLLITHLPLLHSKHRLLLLAALANLKAEVATMDHCQEASNLVHVTLALQQVAFSIIRQLLMDKLFLHSKDPV